MDAFSLQAMPFGTMFPFSTSDTDPMFLEQLKRRPALERK